ncbi:myosin II light chain [Exserohilum turcicum]
MLRSTHRAAHAQTASNSPFNTNSKPHTALYTNQPLVLFLLNSPHNPSCTRTHTTPLHIMASTNYREAFQLFDKRGNGRVDRGALGDLLRACGQNPTLAEIADLERGVGADCKSLIFSTCTLSRLTAMAVDFDTFSKILNRPGGFREPFDIEEYIRGFQVFDKDRSGFVGKGQIKYILTNLGEKMSEEEVDELFKSTIDASNNEVDYREFVKTIAEN